MGPTDRRLLEACRTLSTHPADSWVDEDEAWRTAVPDWSHRRNVRRRLLRLEEEGLLAKRWLRPRGEADRITMTEQGLKMLDRAYTMRGVIPPRPTRPPRLDQTVHHLLVVLAATRIVSARSGRLLRLWGDEDIRSQQRSGQSSHSSSHGGLPDGRLLFRDADHQRKTVDIEIIDGKYTDKKIQEKWEDLRDGRVVFFATTPNVLHRCERLGVSRPRLL